MSDDAANRSGDGGWGSNKQSSGRERGYSINGGSTRRRDDENEYYGDSNYYGRGYDDGYDEESFWGARGRGYDYDESPPRYEDDGRGYYQRPRYRDDEGYDDERYHYYEEQEWRCEECGNYNYDVDVKCSSCGSRPRPRSKSRDGSQDGRSDEEKPPQEPTWPPPFESGGAAYIFHPASGMFFEAFSSFYYDPKTKLYYSNKQQTYYTYSPDQDPPFCALETPKAASGEAGPANEAVNAGKPEAKKKIEISLKTTVLPKSGACKKAKPHKAPKKVKAAPPEPKKQDAANIEVWAERGKEVRKQAADKKPPTTTATNKPVCLLCRRKFTNFEKLEKHKELSTLHKENLEKKRKEEEAKKEREPSSDYRDRALERRLMHPEAAAALPALPRDLDAAATSQTTEVVRPEDSLGSSNIGNQMLQKLGWKSGDSLGRGAADGKDGAQKTLVKDWEKIETLASTGQQGRTKPSDRERGIGH